MQVLFGQNNLQHVACHWSEKHLDASSHWTESSAACRQPLVRKNLTVSSHLTESSLACRLPLVRKTCEDSCEFSLDIIISGISPAIGQKYI
jgi:hypothetical protein